MAQYKFAELEGVHNPILERLLTENRNGVIVDLGCNKVPEHLQNKAQLVDRLIGVDNDDEITAAISQMDRPKNFYFVKGDARELPLPDKSVDLLLMLGIYSQVADRNFYIDPKFRAPGFDIPAYMRENKRRLLSEAARVVKPTGAVLVSNSLRKSQIEVTKNEFSEYLNVQEVNVGGSRYIMVCTPK